jgi:hypothetical protein
VAQRQVLRRPDHEAEERMVIHTSAVYGYKVLKPDLSLWSGVNRVSWPEYTPPLCAYCKTKTDGADRCRSCGAPQ